MSTIFAIVDLRDLFLAGLGSADSSVPSSSFLGYQKFSPLKVCLVCEEAVAAPVVSMMFGFLLTDPLAQYPVQRISWRCHSVNFPRPDQSIFFNN